MSLPSSTCSDTITVSSDRWAQALAIARRESERVLRRRNILGCDYEDQAQKQVVRMWLHEQKGNRPPWRPDLLGFRMQQFAKRWLVDANKTIGGERSRRHNARWAAMELRPSDKTTERNPMIDDLREAIPAMPSLLRETVQWWMANGGNRTRAARDMGVSPPTYAALFNQAAAWLKERLK